MHRTKELWGFVALQTCMQRVLSQGDSLKFCHRVLKLFLRGPMFLDVLIKPLN